MKIEHWKITHGNVRTIERQAIDLHSTGISGDKFELTGVVSTDDQTYVTVSLTRDEVEQFVAAVAKTLGLKVAA